MKAPGSNRDSVQAYEHRAEKKELNREFHEVFDANGDGVLDLDEIVDLFSPSQHSHAISEAYELVFEADANGDHELTLGETKAAARLFHASKLLNWGAAVHTDLEQMYNGMVQRLKRVSTRDEL